mgnify:CR=1 FL=1
MKQCKQCGQKVKKTRTVYGRAFCNWCHRVLVNERREQAVREEFSNAVT